MTQLRFHAMPDGRRIAFRFVPGSAPALMFLPGYMSDMSGSKAQAVLDWAMTQGRACLLLDYSGCGQSSGPFADGTLSRWAEEICALVEAQCEGPVVLVGSSMGGWLMLIVALRLGARVGAMIGTHLRPISPNGASAQPRRPS
jgi:pimeloyl-ACP methyl ester carboxylesterase